jgi:hypothetical protein
MCRNLVRYNRISALQGTAEACKAMEARTSGMDAVSVVSVDDIDDSRLVSFYSSDAATCDACEFCGDCCSNEDCDACRTKRLAASPCIPNTSGNGGRFYTRCQVRRHNHAKSAWLLVGDTIYDATPFLARHPGGAECILRKAGGAQDCSRDLKFHSKQGQRMFQRCEIGKLRDCPGNRQSSSEDPERQWWALW